MKIILYTCPNTMSKILGKGAAFVTKQEPLGLLYIASYLKKYNYDVSITDAFSFGLSGEDIIEEISKEKPDVIGFSVLTSGGKIALDLTKLIKKKFPEILIVLGNIHPSIFAEHYLKNKSADIIVHDEGEVTFSEIVIKFNQKNKWNDIKGISFIDDAGKFVTTEKREVLENLDEIPVPARELIPINQYRMQFYFHPYANTQYYKMIMTSRGCPYKCSFCTVHKSGKIRYHSVERVRDELKILLDGYNSKFIFFMDSLFMSSRKRVLDICNMINENKFKFDWGCEGRVNLAEPSLLKEMKKAGCYEIAYGIESGVQELLNNINKNCTIEQIESAVKYTKEAGIKVMGLFILGLPGEEKKLSYQTIKFAKRLNLDIAQFSICTPYPGSELYNNLINEKKIDPFDWEKYSQYANFTDNEPIWTPEKITGSEIKKIVMNAYIQFYFRPKIIFKLLKNIRINNLLEYVKAAKTFF
ncbi:cobalamin-dependent protein [Candidatus Dependentiae bacterium]|nr:cobalamin-dependent protein [Candidatus Dependentiae bacterium]